MASKKEGFGRGGSAHRLNKADRDMILKKKKAGGANPSQAKNSTKSPKKARPVAAAAPKPEKKPSGEDGKTAKTDTSKAEANTAGNTNTKGINVETDYRTVLDEIYELVEQQGEITLTALSKKLNIPAGRLEEWAKVFDRIGLLELDYPMVGDIIIRKVGYSSKGKKGKQAQKAGGTAAAGAGQGSPTGMAAAKPAEGTAGKDAKSNLSALDAAKQLGDAKAVAAQPAGTAPAKADEDGAASDAERKLKSRKTMRLAMFGIGAVIVALIGVLIYFLIKGGYIQFV
jgi:hypothetical protein